MYEKVAIPQAIVAIVSQLAPFNHFLAFVSCSPASSLKYEAYFVTPILPAESRT